MYNTRRSVSKALLSCAFMLAFCTSIRAQNKLIISGIVKDSQGVDLPGVNIVVKGLEKGTQTDFSGKFSIASEPGKTLVFSYLGMETQEVLVSSDTKNLSIVMQDNVQKIDEVVLTGYQTVKKNMFTGSSQKIKIEDVKMDGVPDPTALLEGRVAGVTVQNVTGTFGSTPRITIRGQSSILGNSQPLWVVDGAVQEPIVQLSLSDLVSGDTNTLLGSALAGINPSDIQSFEILKDASATALYGARALNGVVVITTKTGKKNQKSTISYNGEFTVRPVPSYDSQNILNSQESMAVFQELDQKGFLRIGGSLQSSAGGVYNLYYRAVNTYNPATGRYMAENTPEGKVNFLRKYELANTDWFNTLYRMAPTQTHSLSFTGGGEHSSQFASISYYGDPGWSIAESVNRLTANLRNTYYYGENTSLTLTANGSYRHQKVPGSLSAESDTFSGGITRPFELNPYAYVLGTSRTLRPYDDSGNLEYYRASYAPFNIINEYQNNQQLLNVLDMKAQVDFDAKLFKGMKYKMLGTMRYATTSTDHTIKEGSNFVKSYNAMENAIVRDKNPNLYTDIENPNDLPISVLPNGGVLNKSQNTLTFWNIRNTFDYSINFKDVHDVKVYFGNEVRYTNRTDYFTQGYGIQYDQGNIVNTDPKIFERLAQGDSKYFGSSYNNTRGVVLFITGTYAYKNKYVFNITGSYEGSNRAGRSAASRWLPTYNMGLKWNVLEEDFMRGKAGWLTQLAFRPSFGLKALLAETVSNNLPVFMSAITDRLLQANRETIINISSLQNSNLTWEKNYELNLGLDFGILNNRVGLTVDYYNRRGFDLLDIIRTSAIGGELSKYANNSDMDTHGIEVQINTTNVDLPKFKWTTTLNFSQFKQEVTRLDQRPSAFNLVSRLGGNVLGYAPNSLFSFRFDKLNEQGLPTYNLGPGKDPITGINFQDVENVAKYLKYEGPTLPTIQGGISNSFTIYKNLTFSFFITFSAGNKIRLTPYYQSEYSDLSVFPKDFVNRWINPGDENVTNIPTIPSQRQINTVGGTEIKRIYNAYNFSDIRVADGGFIRMRNISLKYSVPKKLRDFLKLSQLSFSLQATNPFLIYADPKLQGQNPEFFSTGGVASPLAQQYTGSISISL